jgi:hypothetical protein
LLEVFGKKYLKKLRKRRYKFKKNIIEFAKNFLKDFFLKSSKVFKKISLFFFYKKYLYKIFLQKNCLNGENIVIHISQKNQNTKSTISLSKKTLNTFSVGSVIKYFKVNHGKHVRKSLKGLKIFLNFLKNVFEKKYLLVFGGVTNNIIFNLVSFDFNLIFLIKVLRSFLEKNTGGNSFFLFNLCLSFTKKKGKKVKSIKKRLKKKIFLNLLR